MGIISVMMKNNYDLIPNNIEVVCKYTEPSV
jgi:hypothetical protein